MRSSGLGVISEIFEKLATSVNRMLTISVLPPGFNRSGCFKMRRTWRGETNNSKDDSSNFSSTYELKAWKKYAHPSATGACANAGMSQGNQRWNRVNARKLTRAIT